MCEPDKKVVRHFTLSSLVVDQLIVNVVLRMFLHHQHQHQQILYRQQSQQMVYQLIPMLEMEQERLPVL